MINQTISRRYAKALLSIGGDDGNYDQYGREIGTFTQAMGTGGLAEALVNPIYPPANRKQILKTLLERFEFSPIVSNFLSLLMDKGRIQLVEAINGFYERLVDEVNNIQRASVVTASPVSEDVTNQVKQTLEKLTSKTIILETEVDQEIIGGIIAKVGDLTLDGSVKTQLVNLKESLIKG